MAKNTNMVVVSGRVVGDVVFNDKATIGRFTIASSESVKNKEGKWEEYSNFFDVKIFGSTTKVAAYLTKGKSVIVTGTLHQDRWEKDGQKNSRIVINCSALELSGGGKKADGQSSNQEGTPSDSQSGSSTESTEDFPTDIPF